MTQKEHDRLLKNQHKKIMREANKMIEDAYQRGWNEAIEFYTKSLPVKKEE